MVGYMIHAYAEKATFVDNFSGLDMGACGLVDRALDSKSKGLELYSLCWLCICVR